MEEGWGLDRRAWLGRLLKRLLFLSHGLPSTLRWLARSVGMGVK